MLALETGMLGVFCSLDLFLFYVFWEVTLLPMYFLIGIWGGQGRIYADPQVRALHHGRLGADAGGHRGAGGGDRQRQLRLGRMSWPTCPTSRRGCRWRFFGAFALAFAVKVPLFPFHTWLPDAHVEAPTAGSVMLAGVLLKLGAYGFVRLALPLFPAVAVQAVPWVMVLAIIGIWYGAWVAFAQTDVKSLVAYSSVSHMGVVMVGVFALNTVGMSGGVLQMVNHGLVDRRPLPPGRHALRSGPHPPHRRLLGVCGPPCRAYSAVFLVVLLASIGLPGTNGFVGEWLSLLGAFQSQMAYGALAAFGVVLGAAYMLWVYQRVFFGPANDLARRLPDLNGREMLVLLPLVVLIFWIGLFPDDVPGAHQPEQRDLGDAGAGRRRAHGRQQVINVRSRPSCWFGRLPATASCRGAHTMEAVMIGEGALRSVLLNMSHSQRLGHFMTTSSLAWKAASRFVAGETLDEAITTVQELNAQGISGTLDHLGENCTTEAEARAAAEVYQDIVRRIREVGIHSGISVKLTAVGLDLSDALASELIQTIVATGASMEPPVFVRIDMEGSPYTQRTLDIFDAVHGRHANVGAVIQSYLFRSAADVERLIAMGAHVRMVKGAYKEPESIAWPDKADVDASFLRLTDRLMSDEARAKGIYTAVASHDPAIIGWVKSYAERHGVPRDSFEFQFLHGIRRDLQLSLVKEGYRMRVYVPYGRQWYPYFMRRLAERPENVGFIAQNVLRELRS